MKTVNGWDQKLMVSLFKKAASYNAAITVNNMNFCSIKQHTDFNPDMADQVVNDKGTVSGTEHGTDQQIVGYGFKYQYSTPNVHPNELAGFIALALADITSTKDGANSAWLHALVECAAGATLPDVNLIGVKGGVQQLFKGIKCGGFEIKIEEDKPVSFTADLIGSGSRATNADSFVNPITESWIMSNPTKLWLESGADILIDTTPAQGVQAISSTTPDVLGARIKTLSLKYNGNPEEQRMGGDGYNADIDFGRRGWDLSMTLRFKDSTEMAYYESQAALALDLDCTGGAAIDGSTWKFGFKVVIPLMRLKKLPYPQGGVNDRLTASYEADIEEDGTHKAVYIWVWNAVAAYLAA